MKAPFRVYRYALPLVRPLRLGTETITVRHGYILEKDAWGGTGKSYGEMSPLPFFSSEDPSSVPECLIEYCRVLFGMGKAGGRERETMCLRMREAGVSPAAYFGTTAAIQDLPHSLRKPGPWRAAEIRVNGLLIGDGTNLDDELARLREGGYQTVKIKVGRDAVEQDVALVKEVSGRLGPSVCLRLDANRAWDLDQAVRFCEQISALSIEYMEEPLRNPEQAAELKQRVAVSLAADESLRAGACPWANVYVLKPTLDAHAVKRLWQAYTEGKKAVISASFESGIGVGALASWAARYEACDGVASGLDTYHWLAEDVLETRIPIRRGRIALADVAESMMSLNLSKLECIYDG